MFFRLAIPQQINKFGWFRNTPSFGTRDAFLLSVRRCRGGMRSPNGARIPSRCSQETLPFLSRNWLLDVQRDSSHLAGGVVESWAAELSRARKRACGSLGGRKLVVDLTGVTLSALRRGPSDESEEEIQEH